MASYPAWQNSRISGETAAIVSWLHRQALKGANADTILEGLCAQFLAGGFDLDRAVVAYLVFHPQFDGMTFTWTRDTGRAERQAATQPDIRRCALALLPHAMHRDRGAAIPAR